MTNYVLTFRAQPGRTPTAQEEARWPAWFGQIGASITDTGNRVGDSAARLHALASLIAQARQLLPQAVHDARDQELTRAQIGELLGTTDATAARHYRNKP